MINLIARGEKWKKGMKKEERWLNLLLFQPLKDLWDLRWSDSTVSLIKSDSTQQPLNLS